MKTPQQLLFERHRAVEPKLDAIRAKALAETPHAKPQSHRAKAFSHSAFFASWREILLSLRWHLTAMSTVWLLALFLNLDRSSVATTTVAKRNTPSPQQLVAALLENRRQIAELTASPANGTEPVPVPQSFIPPRRSEFPPPTEMV